MALRLLADRTRQQRAAVDAAERSLTPAKNRYEGGITSYLEFVTAQSVALTNKRVAVDLVTRRMVAGVSLVRGIYGGLLAKRAISRATVLVFGFTLVIIAGGDIYLLQSLAALAKITASLADDTVFLSERSLALYLLPAMYGGIGINVVSHILLRHLAEAEREFLEEHPDA